MLTRVCSPSGAWRRKSAVMCACDPEYRYIFLGRFYKNVKNSKNYRAMAPFRGGHAPRAAACRGSTSGAWLGACRACEGWRRARGAAPVGRRTGFPPLAAFPAVSAPTVRGRESPEGIGRAAMSPLSAMTYANVKAARRALIRLGSRSRRSQPDRPGDPARQRHSRPRPA